MMIQMFNKQKIFQEKLNKNIHSQEYINEMVLATIDELMEALRETPWKSWKKNQEMNKDKFKDELIDTIHFIINLCLASGMNANEVYERFINKNKQNLERQNANY